MSNTPKEQVSLEDILDKVLDNFFQLPYPDYNRGLLPGEDGYDADKERRNYEEEYARDEAKAQLTSLIEDEKRKAEKNMASNLIDQEKVLYKIFDDDNKICVGIKKMADEVREYFDGGVYTKS